MKHDFTVTLFLIGLFLVSQVVGLFLLSTIATPTISQNGTIEVKYTDPPTGRPEFENKGDSLYYILAMIFIGTILLLLLIKFRLFKIWKAWFFLAIWGSLYIAFWAIMPEIPAIILSFVLAYLKLFKPNVIVHNITEVFIYGGLAILISPMLNLTVGFLLLIAISIYDAIAVWKLKHMITMATAQADQKMFAGLLIPYKSVKAESAIRSESTGKTGIKLKIPKGFKEENVKTAILGGGDIAFPMIFAGSVMTWLIEMGYTVFTSYLLSLIVALFAGVALFFLLIKSQKDKFYPAMPFISAGCFFGFGIVWLLQLL